MALRLLSQRGTEMEKADRRSGGGWWLTCCVAVVTTLGLAATGHAEEAPKIDSGDTAFTSSERLT